jgi:hypothetical protein
MRAKILLFSLTLASAAFAQRSSRLFYVTDQQKGGYNWSVIRTVSEGTAEQLVMNGLTSKGEVMDALLQKKKSDYGPATSNSADLPMFSGVAALAYDQQHDRLYYATMFSQQLRYINLSEKEGGRYYQAANLASLGRTLQPQNAVNQEQQGPVITRMTIGPDGYGYGISNDGQTFFRFSLNKKTTIESLGSLVDDEKNGNLSVHNACSSWGGDIVAAENGDIYLFTMRQNVFKINPVTRVASFIGRVTGLDNNFTINGAAVDVDGNVILSTAVYPGSRGIIKDFKTLVATEDKNGEFYNSSDLASCNYLFGKPAITNTKVEPINEDRSAGISMYPNPSTNGFAVLKFEDKIAGKLTIDILGSSGNILSRKPVQVNSEGQLVRMNTASLAKGLYVIRVTDASKKEVFNSKLVVQ